MNKLRRVAIIGAGIGSEHLAAYRSLANLFSVDIVCDTDERRAIDIVNGDASITVTDSFESVLNDGSIDIVDICLPPRLHFDAVKSALQSGKHVVCEKPFVSSLRQADEIITMAKELNRVVVPVFQYRYGPASNKLKALMDAGLTGAPLVASVETHWNRTSEYYNNPWRGTWQGEQGGAVLGHAIHNHDFLCTVFGPVKSLSAFTATRVNEIEVEDCASISFEMTNGALATSSITLGAANDTSRMRFCFENITAQSGSLPYAPAQGDWTFEARQNISQQALNDFLANVPETPSGFAGLFEQLAFHLNTGQSQIVSVEDGRRSLELVTAVYDAAVTGHSVSLPLSVKHVGYNAWQGNTV